MRFTGKSRAAAWCGGLLACIAMAGAPSIGAAPPPGSLLARDNLLASGIDDNHPRTAEERARMLEKLGLKQVVLGGIADDAILDAQVAAMQRHGIRIFAWGVFDTNEPVPGIDWRAHQVDAPQEGKYSLGELLDAFKRHDIRPQLWVIRNMQRAKSAQPSSKPFAQMTPEERDQEFRKLLNYDPTPARERAWRVSREAEHFKPLAQLAASYGLQVAIFKHGGWLNIEDNLVAVIERLETLGVDNVGMVYRFIHAHDEVDDTVDFPAVWKKIQPYVRVVDITGMHAGRTRIYPILYPSQGDLELGLMRTIQASGWRGPIGVSTEKSAEGGGDAETHLRNNLLGLDWLAAELEQPGSGGPRPLGHVP